MGTIDASGLEDITSTAKHTVDEVEAKYGQDGRDNPIDKKPFCHPDSAVTHQASPIVAPQRSRLKLDLPTFDGNLLSWRDFWSLFSSILDKEPDLSDEQKGCVLIKSMAEPQAKARAQEAVSNTADYKSAVEHLKEVYDRALDVYIHHIHELFQPATIEDNAKDLRHHLDRVERSI